VPVPPEPIVCVCVGGVLGGVALVIELSDPVPDPVTVSLTL